MKTLRAGPRRRNQQAQPDSRVHTNKAPRGFVGDRIIPVLFVFLVLVTLGLTVFAAGVLLGLISYE